MQTKLTQTHKINTFFKFFYFIFSCGPIRWLPPDKKMKSPGVFIVDSRPTGRVCQGQDFPLFCWNLLCTKDCLVWVFFIPRGDIFYEDWKDLGKESNFAEVEDMIWSG